MKRKTFHKTSISRVLLYVVLGVLCVMASRWCYDMDEQYGSVMFAFCTAVTGFLIFCEVKYPSRR
jgi:hypothetical protein